MMMKELSLHILDIVENSIVAGGANIHITIYVDHSRDAMSISVQDDGCGMEEAMALAVTNPVTTSRTTRKVGLGIPMFKAGAEACDGEFSLTSKPGQGTLIKATYRISHLDRPPLGNMAETMLSLIICNQTIRFVFDYHVDERQFYLDTDEIHQALGADIPFDQPDVLAWIRDYLKEGIEELNGGV